MGGGKMDFTTKWWNPSSYQAVIDHFKGKIQFVQCGETGHWHPDLNNVIDMRGKTDPRQFVRMMYHADGVLCPITFAMHLAAAVEVRPGAKSKNRACVVVAGGREPPHWEAYPHHRYLSTNGALMCCDNGGCWKSRVVPLGDGDEKDLKEKLCKEPVNVESGDSLKIASMRSELHIAKCMTMITPQDVIRAIEMYYEGGAFSYCDDTPGCCEGGCFCQ
jgi:ADP-heptose:LPS heptosyltransferase